MSRDDSKARIWAARLDRYRRSGLSLAQFCRNEDVSVHNFYYWRKKIGSVCTNTSTPIASPRLSDTTSRPLHFTIEARGVKIECRSESFEAIEMVLTWAAGQQDSGFQQLIVRD
jgi:acetyl esterase/lipase